MSLPRPGRLLGRALGLVGRIALKFSLTRRMVLAIVGIVAAVILVLVLLVVLIGG